jgi:hypothetical protein
MRGFWPRPVRSGCLLMALFVPVAWPPADGQQSTPAETDIARVQANSSFSGNPTANEIVDRMLAENDLRSERLKRYAVMRTYQLRTLEGNVAAKEIVRMEYREPGVKTFEKSSEEGSGIVRRLVFDRLMDSESQSASGKDRQDSAVTPANYEFRFLREEDLGTYHCFVLKVVPKRKDKYLFEGQIWIESHDFGIAKIDGSPARKISFWINRVEFVRQYQKVDDFWLPLRDETEVDVKLYGRRVLIIEHGPYVMVEKTEHIAAPVKYLPEMFWESRQRRFRFVQLPFLRSGTRDQDA